MAQPNAKEVLDRNPLRARFLSLEVTNFLSYKHARLELEDLIALVGPNASGKSNLVAAFKLLREIPVHGLPVALARRGGFDQLRHRSSGRPYDPGIRVEFLMGDSSAISTYELKLGAVNPRSYKVKSETGSVYFGDEWHTFVSDGVLVKFTEPQFDDEGESLVTQISRDFPVPPGQSAISSAGFAGYLVFQALQQIQTVEINPASVADLQMPSSVRDFEPDGSNATSIFDLLDSGSKAQLVDELNAIVPGVIRVEVLRLADRQTFRFVQATGHGNREFNAKQMSDGTLRAFSVLLALKQPKRPSLYVIEEPEVAIHLGALRTLMEILSSESAESQIVLTTHSADIVDSVPIEALRVVWNEAGESHVGEVAAHTIHNVREGLITPGELLRSDSLDVSVDQ